MTKRDLGIVPVLRQVRASSVLEHVGFLAILVARRGQDTNAHETIIRYQLA
jgi:hypothetical protein